MLKDRSVLEANLAESIDKIKHKKTNVNKIKKNLQEYQIRPGVVQKYINDPELLHEVDLRFLCLLTEQVYNIAGDLNVKTDEYFTEDDIKQSRLYSADMEDEEKIEFPITLDNVLMIDDENYITLMDIKFIKKLFTNKLLRYNFETQRESRFVRRQGSIERVANVNMNSVNEIKERLLSGQLSVTTLSFNAIVGSATSGDELTPNVKKQQLTINAGTYLDILDGFHRITGAMNALDERPDLDFKFQVSIKNYNVATAQKHLAEISKINVISKSHIEALESSRLSDTVVKQLQRDSELKGRVSQTERIHSLNKELCSYKLLSDTVDEVFKMETKKDAMDVAEYLTEFFDYLLGSFSEEFIEKVEETREKSLICANSMFAGYITLAYRMRQNNIKINKLPKILYGIDFNRDNPMWEEMEILQDGKITNKARKKIKEYFSKIELGEGVVNGK